MESPQLADSYVALLEKSGLLPRDQIASALKRFSLPSTAPAKEMARAFFNSGLLTRYQAERLLEGKFRGFFIDQYILLEILGAGGMARIYMAENRQTGERVALKVISDQHKADAGMLTRLKIEAHAGKKIQHPAVIRTIEIRKTDDVFGEIHYLVMEFVAGINLEELINLEGPIPWSQAADFAKQAAEGLQFAHAAGLVHRDVKPGNILVNSQGEIKVFDFGLALLDGRGDENADEFSLAMIFGHNCLGTADYIAPEQIVDSLAVDRRADIYSLGCTLYVALTGKLPYPALQTAEKLQGHCHLVATPVRSLVPEIPEGMAQVVQKMMAKSPQDRYATMAEVAAALAPFAKRQGVEFDFPRILATRAKLARRRVAGQARIAGSSLAGSKLQKPASQPVLRSASTKRLPLAVAETAVASPRQRDAVPESVVAVSGIRPDAAPTSKPERKLTVGSAGAVLVPLNGAPQIPLNKPTIVLGRDLDCDVHVASSAVSGKHCELHFDGSQWRILDLGSKNGVQVNGRAASDEPLAPGDRISLASQQHYRIEYSVATPALSSTTVRWVRYSLLAAVLLAGLLWVLQFFWLR
ncbi:MAG: protein kinase [Planctomycetes bacterium]|nr:protein kinase [Planctomycetota bacterium]